MIRRWLLVLCVAARLCAQKTGAEDSVASLSDVKRIYVAELTGGAQAAALRDLIIASLSATKLFVLTEKEDRADAILKGAADDHTFTDTFDSFDGINTHQTGGKASSGSGANKTAAIYGSVVAGDNESHHIKERKHEAYAAVRLCNRDGDVLWSTTQESLGAKFRGASADVAAKVAKQISTDYDHALHPVAAPAPAKP
jgi:hypothetical protein